MNMKFLLTLFVGLVLATPGATALLLRGDHPRPQHDAAAVGNLSFTASNTTVPTFSVCAMGDSITDGLQGHDDVYVNRGGFRTLLSQYVEQSGGELTGYNTCPCPAYPNARSSQLHVQLKKEGFLCGSGSGLVPRTPDIALLLIGTNDLVQHVTVEQTLTNVRSLLQDLWMASPQTVVLLASIPVHRGNPGPFDAYNAGLRQIALDLKPASPIEYVPMSEDTGICSSGLCHSDLIHPTAEGYSAMANEWWKFIQPRISSLRATYAHGR